MFSGGDGDLIDTVVLGKRCSALVSVGILEVSIEDYGSVQFVLKSRATVAGNASDDRFKFSWCRQVNRECEWVVPRWVIDFSVKQASDRKIAFRSR